MAITKSEADPETLETLEAATVPSSSSIGTQTDEAGEKKPEGLDQSGVSGDGEEDVEEEEETECGFCVFMKGGGCRDSFIAWENCVEDAEKNKEDIVEKCAEVTGLLKKCMDAHPDYYEPILRAEKAMEEEATKELEQREFEPLEYHEN